MKPTEMPHIFLNEKGRPVIEQTRHKVKFIAIQATTWKMPPEAIQKQFPDLSLAQIHAALTYYYDHQTEMDAEIERDDQEYEKLVAENQNSPIRQKLRAMGKIQ